MTNIQQLINGSECVSSKLLDPHRAITDEEEALKKITSGLPQDLRPSRNEMPALYAEYGLLELKEREMIISSSTEGGFLAARALVAYAKHSRATNSKETTKEKLFSLAAVSTTDDNTPKAEAATQLMRIYDEEGKPEKAKAWAEHILHMDNSGDEGYEIIQPINQQYIDMATERFLQPNKR
jgi:hypothetical protein